MTNKLYNLATWIWYKILCAPIRLSVVLDNKVKHPIITVVFLHGISATSATWRTTFKDISQQKGLQNVRLVALDLLGFGKSLKADWLKYNENDYCHALYRAIKKIHLRHSKLVIVGHSMGGLIAADYAQNFNERTVIEKLILVSPPVLMTDELAKLPDRVYTKSYSSLHKLATDVPALETVAKLIQKFTSFRSDYIKTAAFERSMENIILNRKNYQTFTHLKVPTVLIHGHFDPLVMGSNLRRVAKQNPRHVKYISVIGQHDVSVGKRAKIIVELRKTLKEVTAHEAL